MQNKNNNKKNNRNTSYYKLQVRAGAKKAQGEDSVFFDKAKKRQMNNYRLAMLVLFGFMIAFAGLIALGIFLNSFVDVTEGDETADNYTDNPFAALPSKNDDNSNDNQNNNPDSNAAFNPATDDPAVPQPTEPVEISEIFFNYNGVYLDVQKIESLDSLQYFIDNIKSKNINAVNIDIKKEDGTVPYHINGQTDSVMMGASQIEIPIEEIINLLHANGIYVSGTVACFKDTLAGTTFVNYALHSSGTASMRWEDSEGNFWLSAYSKDARAYIQNIVEDSARLGFDEIILSWFFFPYTSNEKNINYGDEDDNRGKYTVIKDFVVEQKRALDNIAPKIKLGLNIPLGNFLSIPNETMGLNPVDLVEWCNFFATSFAPADVPYGAKINNEVISNPENSPYETVKSLCAHFKYMTDNTNFRPSIQAFGNYGEQQVQNQKQALYEAGVNIWQIVNYDNYY